MPDGERILTWRQIYDLPELPSHLIVIGSGVTGAEFASAYLAMGVSVTLVSSRDRVMPHEDVDASIAIEKVFRARGMDILNNSRAAGVRSTGDGVEVTLADGRVVSGLARADGGRFGAEHAEPQPRRVRRRGRSRRLRDGGPRLPDERARRLRGRRLYRRCSRWPASPRCRAGSRCGTRSARRSRR